MIKNKKIISILLTAFMTMTLALFSGCDILNNSVIQGGVFVEETDEAPGPEAAAPESDEPQVNPWQLRFETWPLAFGFANDEGSKLIHVFYDFSDSDADTGEDPADPEAGQNADPDGEGYDEYDDENYEPFNYFAQTGFDTDAFSLAVGPYGQLWPIFFSSWQAERRGNSGRENANNFNNLPGFVFGQKDWKLVKNQTHLITDMGPLLDSVVAITPSGWRGNFPPLEDEMAAIIEDQKERKIEWTQTLGLTQVGEGLIGLVLFERQGSDMLFSIVYMDDEKTLYWDKPAAYNEEATWRAGQGAEPGRFEPLLLARFEEGLILILTWSAPESELSLVLYEENGVFKQAGGLTSERIRP